MQTSRIIDYTDMRKGTKTGKTSSIQYCPKCGRKGKFVPGSPKPQYTHEDKYIHQIQEVNLDGFVINNLTDVCTIYPEKENKS